MELDIYDLYPELIETKLKEPRKKNIKYSKHSKLYIEKVKGNASQIMADALKVLNALEKDDFECDLLGKMAIFEEGVKQQIDDKDLLEFIGKRLKRDPFSMAYEYTTFILSVFFDALEYYNLPEGELNNRVLSKAGAWYEPPEDWGRHRDEATNPAEKAREVALENIAFSEIRQILYPVDKINSKVWNELAASDKDGQFKFSFDMAKRDSGEKALVWYSINFDEAKEITISKELTPYDKRVYIAANAIHAAGNDTFTLTQIYTYMGYTGAPGKKDFDKLNSSLQKMTRARIYISNEYDDENKKETDSEKKAHEKAVAFTYDGSLLPMETITARVNGQITDAAIHLLRKPPLVDFAEKRGQITTIEPKLLQSPVSKTSKNLSIDDYLIERISHMKNALKAKKNPITKILYDTLFAECKIKDSKSKKRAEPTILKYLEYYEKVGFIAGYEQLDNGVNIQLQ